jgi:hypothetical protein
MCDFYFILFVPTCDAVQFDKWITFSQTTLRHHHAYNRKNLEPHVFI